MRTETQREPPVKVGEEHTLTIEAIGQKGDGVAKVKGFVVIVEQPINKGDVVTVNIHRVNPTLAFSKVVDYNPQQKGPDKPTPLAPEYVDTDDFGEEESEDPDNGDN